MAASPNYKIYNDDGGYVASVKDPVHGLVLVSFMGKGSTMRWGHSKQNTLWHEGFEDRRGDENYDHNYDVVRERVKAIWARQEEYRTAHLEKCKKGPGNV
ncbi:MAG: hypothetical protein ACPGQQ_02900 [Candidatus Puniceispirillaceae bacterium]